MMAAERKAEGGEEGFKLFRQFSAGNFFAKKVSSKKVPFLEWHKK